MADVKRMEPYEKKADVIVLAAGRGRRMNADRNKMYLSVDQVPIIYRTLRRFDQSRWTSRIFLVCKDEERHTIREILEKYGVINKPTQFVSGGDQRCDSVKNGLQAFLEQSPSRWVMVHDGARPFFSQTLVRNLIDAAATDQISVPVLKMTETLRRRREDDLTEVIDRDSTFAVQTPQVFSKEMIVPCFFGKTAGGEPLTDEASYFEAAGKKVTMIEGEKWNIKITTREDIRWAECLLKSYPELRQKGLDIQENSNGERE